LREKRRYLYPNPLRAIPNDVHAALLHVRALLEQWMATVNLSKLKGDFTN
jgi:hypothetical protein